MRQFLNLCRRHAWIKGDPGRPLCHCYLARRRAAAIISDRTDIDRTVAARGMRCFTDVPEALDRLSLSAGAFIVHPESTVKSIDRRRFLTVTLAFAGAAAIGSRLGPQHAEAAPLPPASARSGATNDLVERAQVVIVGPRRRRRRGRRWTCWWSRGRRVCGWRW
jgi:hypothetical protein